MPFNAILNKADDETTIFPDYRYRSYNRDTLTRTYGYIVAKLVIFFFYSGIWIWVAFELIFPIYDWWWTLGRLADFIPYTRPTEQQVLDADVIGGLIELEFDASGGGSIVDDEVRF